MYADTTFTSRTLCAQRVVLVYANLPPTMPTVEQAQTQTA
jgi:hypothetical protein